MSDYTLEDLAALKKAYARGVLRVREGDTWIEYQSMREMKIAIDLIETELNVERATRPRGSRRVRFGTLS